MKKLTGEDSETRSADVLAGKIEQLKTLFPEAVTQGGIDFEVLKQLLGWAVEERPETCGLNWYGKHRAPQRGQTPGACMSQRCRRDRINEHSEVGVRSCV